MKIICYKCNSLSEGINICSSCNFSLDRMSLLATTVILAYNKALELKDKKHIIKSWELIKTHLFIYPYVYEILSFSYWLAIENGDYKNAVKILNQLKPVMSLENYQKRLEFIKWNISIYNEIISGKFDYDSIDDINFSLNHLYILFLQKNREKQTHILNKINKIDPYFAASLTTGKVLPSFRKITLLKGAVVFILGLAGGLYNYLERNERIELVKKRDNDQKMFVLVRDSLEMRNNELLVSESKAILNNTILEGGLKQINSRLNEKIDEVEILKTRITNIQNERSIFEKRISELVNKNTNYLSDLEKGQKNLIELQTDKSNLTESIQELSKLSLNLTEQNDMLKDAIENDKTRDKKEREFFSLIQRGVYKESLSYLESNELLDFLRDSADYILLDICNSLFRSKDYETLLNVPFDCLNKPDAYYISYLQLGNETNRINNIIQFIEMFPQNKNYTAPLLLELIENYISKGDSNRALIYSLILKEHVVMYLDHQKYYNSTVRKIIDGGK